MFATTTFRPAAAILGLVTLAGCASIASPATSVDKRIVTVETTAPVPASETIIANDTAWNCNGTACSGRVDYQNVSVRECRKLVREIGTIKSYKNGFGELDESEIAACNTSAKT